MQAAVCHMTLSLSVLRGFWKSLLPYIENGDVLIAVELVHPPEDATPIVWDACVHFEENALVLHGALGPGGGFGSAKLTINLEREHDAEAAEQCYRFELEWVVPEEASEDLIRLWDALASVSISNRRARE